jgi:hypothetical protein
MTKRHEHEVPPRGADGYGWRRVHHSPQFWVGVALFLGAISIYLWPEDLSQRPRI